MPQELVMKMGSEKRALDKIYKRRDRYEIPEWQRAEVWADDRKQLLIDTILRGWKIPKFYFAKVSEAPEEFEVVDGQQRLMTIFEFFDGLLSLSPSTAQRVGAETYAGLPEHISDAFDDYEISYDEITESTEEDLKEYFRRLQFGLTLTASEQLNAVHSNLTNSARRLSKHDFFKRKVWIRDTRKAHFDIAAKVAAIAVDGIDTGLRLADLTKTYLANAKFSDDSNTGKLLTATFDFLDRAFPDRDPMLRNRSTIQSIATLASKIIEANQNPGCESRFLAFCQHFGKELAQQIELGHKATDSDYLEFQRTISANIKAGARNRHEILLRKLLLFDPNFVEFLAPESVVASNMNADVTRLGESIGTLIEKINDRYSAQSGYDLFKATNKTAGAIRRLGEPVNDFASYKAFIDDLYFVFREGVGQRLAGNEPGSFVDVNLLRTALQHDVEHGNPKEAAAKKRKLGETFKKYGGTGAPSGVAPEYFSVIQASILRALEADLKGLL
jgi:Protein of unknown function DUF262